MPHFDLDTKTPFKRLSGKEVNYSHLNIVGARAFVHIMYAKLEPKCWERTAVCLHQKKIASLPDLEHEDWQGSEKQKRQLRRDLTTSDSTAKMVLSSQEIPSEEMDNDYASSDDLLRNA